MELTCYLNAMKGMKYIIGVLLIAGMYGCMEETPLDREQYIKQVYLANSFDILYKTTLKYSDEPQSAFVSVASSGSLPLDRDVTVTLGVDTAAVRSYNEKYLGRQKMAEYYKVLPDSVYEMPTMSVTLKKEGNIYERCPIFIQTAHLHCDSAYVIPLTIVSSTVYPVSDGLETILFSFELENDYSGIYQMMGEKVNTATGDKQPIAKSKTLTAYSKDKLRMYVDVLQEEKEKMEENCLLLEIRPDNSVILVPYGSLVISQVEAGTYDPAAKSIQLKYEYTLDGETWQVNETLIQK